MARKSVAAVAPVQQELADGEWSDDVPEEVQNEVDEYMKNLRTQHKATEKTNASKERAIAAMKKHNIPRVRIDEGKKWLVCTDAA